MNNKQKTCNTCIHSELRPEFLKDDDNNYSFDTYLECHRHAPMPCCRSMTILQPGEEINGMQQDETVWGMLDIPRDITREVRWPLVLSCDRCGEYKNGGIAKWDEATARPNTNDQRDEEGKT